jgi:DNA-binding response OmpR family regulator
MKKVLIVDDDRLITKVYERHFRNDGFDVRVANGGQAGLQAVRDFGPDAVLLDLNMPDLNGTDWLTEIRSDARFARLPVLVLTAATIGWQVWAASNMDVAFMFKKNAVPKEVVQAINDAITTARAPVPAPSPSAPATRP